MAWPFTSPRSGKSGTSGGRRGARQVTQDADPSALRFVTGGHGGAKLKADYRRIAARRGLHVARVAVLPSPTQGQGRVS
jgi:hypothetical protein